MRVFKQSGRKTLLLARRLLAHDAGQEPDAGVDQGHRADLAAGQNVIANGDFLEPAGFDQALVNPFEASAQDEHTRAYGQRLGPPMREGGPTRAHEQASTHAQVRETIRTALDYLPAPYADVLEWKYVLELSVADIAARLGRSTKATESLLTRARDAFRETFVLLRGTSGDGAQPS